MPKYEVTLWEKITHTVIVEAEDRDEARESAIDLAAHGEAEVVSQGYSATIVTEV